MKYLVTVADRTVEVEVDGDQVTVGGRTVTATLSPLPGTPLRQLLMHRSPASLAIDAAGRGVWEIVHRGERWEVEVIDERTRHIRSLTGGGAAPRGTGTLRAPMPGLVLRVLIESGQSVGRGAGLVVLEAMKMENELRAPGDAVVRAVRVRQGEAVEKGQVLLEFE